MLLKGYPPVRMCGRAANGYVRRPPGQRAIILVNRRRHRSRSETGEPVDVLGFDSGGSHLFVATLHPPQLDDACTIRGRCSGPIMEDVE